MKTKEHIRKHIRNRVSRNGKGINTLMSADQSWREANMEMFMNRLIKQAEFKDRPVLLVLLLPLVQECSAAC